MKVELGGLRGKVHYRYPNEIEAESITGTDVRSAGAFRGDVGGRRHTGRIRRTRRCERSRRLARLAEPRSRRRRVRLRRRIPDQTGIERTVGARAAIGSGRCNARFTGGARQRSGGIASVDADDGVRERSRPARLPARRCRAGLASHRRRRCAVRQHRYRRGSGAGTRRRRRGDDRRRDSRRSI